MRKSLLSGLAVIAALAACMTMVASQAVLAEDMIKLGVAGPHSGDLASYAHYL